MITVIDSGVANLASVMAALKRLNVEAEITDDPVRIRNATRLILPGVGAAAPAMARLSQKNLPEIIKNLTQPVLGICLGMQLMFENSEEGSGVACLGIFPGSVTRMPSAPNRPIPHMGWNALTLKNPAHPMLKGVEDGAYVYFVHSYAAAPAETTLATADYGASFTAVAGVRNFFGCQFHPERSSLVGSRILANFLEL